MPLCPLPLCPVALGRQSLSQRSRERQSWVSSVWRVFGPDGLQYAPHYQACTRDLFPFNALMRASTSKKIMAPGTQPKISAWFVAGSGLCVGLGFLAKRALSRKQGYGDVVETPTSNPGWSPPSKQAAPEKGALKPKMLRPWTGMISRLPPHGVHP